MSVRPSVRWAGWCALLFGCGAPSPPATPPAAPPSWTALRIEWSYGPCPATGKSCHQEARVSPDGGVVTTEYPNSQGAPLVAKSRLTDDQQRSLAALLSSAEMQRGMKNGFACEQPSFDARVVITRTDAAGELTREVATCVSGGTTDANPPRALLEILGAYRYVSSAAGSH